MSTQAEAHGEAVLLVWADSQCPSDLEVSWENKPQYSFQSSLWLQISIFKGITVHGFSPYLLFDIYWKVFKHAECNWIQNSRRDGKNRCHIKIQLEIENLSNTDWLKCHSCGYDFICLYPLFYGYHFPPSIPHAALQQYSNTPLYSPECQHIRRLGRKKKKKIKSSFHGVQSLWSKLCVLE